MHVSIWGNAVLWNVPLFQKAHTSPLQRDYCLALCCVLIRFCIKELCFHNCNIDDWLEPMLCVGPALVHCLKIFQSVGMVKMPIAVIEEQILK